MRPVRLRSVPAAVTGVATGAAAWSVTEYTVHRWVLHGPFGKGRLSKVPIGGIHRHHHGDPDHTVLLGRAAGHAAMAAVGTAAGAALARWLPRAFAFALSMTWSAGYSTYDILHWRAHHRPPTSSFGRRLRQRHFRHHFGAPLGNLGVTMSWWDTAFGTEVAERPVTVPRRFAPDWLDELGPEFVAATGAPVPHE